MAGEFELVEWICGQHRAGGSVMIPPGDDLAGLRWDGADVLLVGVDQVLDGVHFDSAIHSARQIAAKAMNRNLSDCAAMACLAAGAVATVALARGTSLEYAKDLYIGMREAGGAFDCPIIGGDTATWGGPLAVTVTILGRSAGIRPVTRGGARPGDILYVSGALGGSILGRHMTFVPRVRLARELAGAGGISAMIDLSDGLSRDVGHICRQSGVGAMIDGEKIPVHADVGRIGPGARTPLEHALHDGEDYELLFTSRHCEHPSAIAIGEITAGTEILLRRGSEVVKLDPLGWEHGL